MPAPLPRPARRHTTGVHTGPMHGPDEHLPLTTSDEQDTGWGERPEQDDDERLLREVPPHHGG